MVRGNGEHLLGCECAECNEAAVANIELKPWVDMRRHEEEMVKKDAVIDTLMSVVRAYVPEVKAKQIEKYVNGTITLATLRDHGIAM